MPNPKKYQEKLNDFPHAESHHIALCSIACSGLGYRLDPARIFADLRQVANLHSRQITDKEIEDQIKSAMEWLGAETRTDSLSACNRATKPVKIKKKGIPIDKAKAAEHYEKQTTAFVEKLKADMDVGDAMIFLEDQQRNWLEFEKKGHGKKGLKTELKLKSLNYLYDADDLIYIGTRYSDKIDDELVIFTAQEWQDEKLIHKGISKPLFTINPLKDRTSRERENVLKFKYCLLEFDDIDKYDQLILLTALIKEGMPIASITYSAGKSLHALVKVKDINTLAEWDAKIKEKFYDLGRRFGACQGQKHPSSMSRLPGGRRDENGWIKRQTALYIAKDIPDVDPVDVLESLCKKYSLTEYVQEQPREVTNFIMIQTGMQKRKVEDIANDILSSLPSGQPLFCYHNAVSFFVEDDVKTLDDTDSFLGWVKNRMEVNWGTEKNLLGKKEFFSNVRFALPQVDEILRFPALSDGRFIQRYKEVEPSENNKILHDFINFFKPASELDKCMLYALFAAPMFRMDGIRPAFLIKGETGKNCGKSYLAETVMRLYGNRIKTASGHSFTGAGYETFRSELITADADFVYVDNWDSTIGGGGLAGLITSRQLDGRAKYARTPIVAKNVLTVLITSNVGRITEDCSDRVYIIQLAEPTIQERRGWETKVSKYLETHKETILADLYDMLVKDEKELVLQGRYQHFDRLIMTNFFDQQQYDAFHNRHSNFRIESSTEQAEAEQIVETFKQWFGDNLSEVRIQSIVVDKVIQTIFGDTRKTGRLLDNLGQLHVLPIEKNKVCKLNRKSTKCTVIKLNGGDGTIGELIYSSDLNCGYHRETVTPVKPIVTQPVEQAEQSVAKICQMPVDASPRLYQSGIFESVQEKEPEYAPF